MFEALVRFITQLPIMPPENQRPCDSCSQPTDPDTLKTVPLPTGGQASVCKACSIYLIMHGVL
jgi:hypothetical protein